MASGDDATSAGYPIVPDTGEEGRIRWGAREINRTRDFIAILRNRITPINLGGTGAIDKSGARTNFGFRSGTADPTGGDDGDVYFKIV